MINHHRRKCRSQHCLAIASVKCFMMLCLRLDRAQKCATAPRKCWNHGPLVPIGSTQVGRVRCILPFPLCGTLHSACSMLQRSGPQLLLSTCHTNWLMNFMAAVASVHCFSDFLGFHNVFFHRLHFAFMLSNHLCLGTT